MKYSLPNILSLLRVLIAPIIYQMIVSHNQTMIFYALIIFSLGAITDYLDGFFARKWGDTSSFGSFLDPIADKILTNAALLALMSISILDAWMIVIIIARDILMTLLRVYADRVDKPINTSFTAKFKTAIQLIFTIGVLLLLSFDPKLEYLPQWHAVIDYTVWSIVFLTVFTSIEYFIQNKALLVLLGREPKLPGIHTMLATFFGIGFSPFAPGTVASITAVLILLFPITHLQLFLLSCSIFLISFWSIAFLERKHGNDASIIVIDEVLGMWFILSFPTMSHSPLSVLFSLVIFRLFDIVKPFPINIVNKQKGPFWVLADDLLAAILTIFTMFLLSILQIGSNLLFMR
ncbi:MAG: CDP-diacylglycerol--glycerol-3-phosphate 3-phosphatidyltransferase [Ignavibacteria bacterium]